MEQGEFCHKPAVDSVPMRDGVLELQDSGSEQAPDRLTCADAPFRPRQLQAMPRCAAPDNLVTEGGMRSLVLAELERLSCMLFTGAFQGPAAAVSAKKRVPVTKRRAERDTRAESLQVHLSRRENCRPGPRVPTP